MMKIFGALSAIALATAAQAGSFQGIQLLTVDAGGGLSGYEGPGFEVSRGGFFNTNFDSAITGPSPGAFNAANFFEFDSYAALERVGPAVRNRSTGTANNSNLTLNFYGRDPGQVWGYNAPGGTAADHNLGEQIPGYAFITGPGSHIGDPGNSGDAGTPDNQFRGGWGVAPPDVISGFAPNATGGRSNLPGVFIARMTVQAGAQLSGGVFVNMREVTENFLGQPIYAGTVMLGGPAVVLDLLTPGSGGNDPQQTAQAYGLRAYKVGTVDITVPSTTGPTAESEEAFGEADVYDIWFQVIPTPGAVAVLGLGALAGLRRRRA